MRYFFSFNLFSVPVFFYKCLLSKRSNAIIRRVSLICLLGLIVSTGSLIVIFNVMGGLGQSIREKFLASEPHLIVTWKSTKNSTNLIAQKKKQIQNLLQANHLKEGIKKFYFFETTDLVIKTIDGVFSGVVARGYEPEDLKYFLNTLYSNPSYPFVISDKEDSLFGGIPLEDESIFIIEKPYIKPSLQKKVIMSLGLASELNLYEGEFIHFMPVENLLLPPSELMHFKKARIDQVVSTQNESWNANVIFYNRHLFNFSSNSSYSNGFEIRLKNPNHYKIYEQALENHGFLIETWPERNSSIFLALKLEKMIMSLFLSLAGLITLLAVSSLLILLLVQKKREIGALMALGASIQTIRSVFIGIGVLLCGLGVLVGSILGLLVCFLLTKIPFNFLSGVYDGSLLPVNFHVSFLIGFIACAVLVSLISCWLSVQTQLRQTPVSLLKSIQG